MLTDPLLVGKLGDTITLQSALSTGVTPEAWRTVDLSATGSKRISTLAGYTKSELIIAHSQSKENAGFVTNRHMIRINRQKLDTVTGKLVNMSVYVVAALPVCGVFTLTDLVTQLRSLGLYLMVESPASNGALTQSTLGDNIPRLLAGEG